MSVGERFDKAEALQRLRSGAHVANVKSPERVFFLIDSAIYWKKYNPAGILLDESKPGTGGYAWSRSPARGWYQVQEETDIPTVKALPTGEANTAQYTGVVYLIWQVGDQLLFKIGYSSQGARKRIADLNTGNPGKLKLMGTRAGGPTQEKALHMLYQEYQHKREWFLLPAPVAKEVCGLFGSDVPGG